MARQTWRTALAGGLLLTAVAAADARAQAPVQVQVQPPAQEPFAPPPGAVPYYSRHAVFRPTFDIPTRRPLMESGYEFPTKPVFLKGYSGSTYGRGPREVFVPTGYGTGYITPTGVGAPAACGPRFGRRWLGR